jgi:hypothetical protein
MKFYKNWPYWIRVGILGGILWFPCLLLGGILKWDLPFNTLINWLSFWNGITGMKLIAESGGWFTFTLPTNLGFGFALFSFAMIGVIVGLVFDLWKKYSNISLKSKLLLVIVSVLIFIIAWICFPISVYILEPQGTAVTYFKGQALTGDNSVIINKYASLTRGSVVVFEDRSYGLNWPRPGRIIGLPNESIEFQSCKIFVNNKELNIKEFIPNASGCVKKSIAPGPVNTNLSFTLTADSYLITDDNTEKDFITPVERKYIFGVVILARPD